MTTDNHDDHPTVTLAQLRQARGLSQSAVAERMGVGQARISQIEKDFPNLHYTVVANYFRAIDTAPRISLGGQGFTLDDIRAAPRSGGAQANRRSRSADGIAKLQSAAEELPLKQRDTDPGSDNPGWGVDQPDTQSDQADNKNGKDT